MSGEVQQIDWEQIRRSKFASVNVPPEWPADVNPVSLNGVSLLGIDANNNLYWDGKRLQLATRLGTVERVLAVLVSIGTVSSAVIEGLDLYLTWTGKK
ncbi:hypothetical protein [Rhizobium redzepovicii]|uniref:hypothetical protein n=1 Tax=Rhizobium redzepovicii TaxID=2867518 RepID=UPI002870F626|nr:hypothetical protein [Rhizobium redzepovicii]MDR9783458.1 hypothetical protein [Rhizobium redzepovicii]